MRFVFALFALFALDLSASTEMPWRSMTFNLGGMHTTFPKQIHQRLRKEIAKELKDGNIRVYRDEMLFNNSAMICVEAMEDVLFRLPKFIDEYPASSQSITLNASPNPCQVPGNETHLR